MSSLMLLVSHVGPKGSHRSVAGVIVTVKSRFGELDSGSLKTLSSTPALVSAMVGFSISGPIRRRTSAGSGPPADVACASAFTAPTQTAAHARMQRALEDATPTRAILLMPAPRHAQGSQLSIQVCTLDAERSGRLADSTAGPRETGGDVLSREVGTGLFGRPAVGEAGRSAAEPDVSQDVLEADSTTALRAVNDRLEQRAKLRGVAAPRQRRNQRQRRARQRLR